LALNEERLTRSCHVISTDHRESVAPSFSHLQEMADFGSNPGALRMLTFLADNLSPRPALVVVLHGSMQSAADYDRGAGWSTLADQYGFALLIPEQSRQNNLTRSFNWFEPADTQREKGEAHSIMQMVEKMVSDHHIDRTRIFVTGLSAGGAMTLAMLASYPEAFAAGAVIAGLPYGAATNAQQALRDMFQAPPKSSRELGDLVREASPNTAVWPRLSVWHGSADRTVKPSNAGEIIKQWLDVHGPSVDADVRANRRRAISASLVEHRWKDGDRILHNCRHGTRHPTFLLRERDCRTLHDRGGHLLVGSYREIFWVE
jgi:poly(hydroxyalkanoate) depolymerase family esterase